MKLGTISRSSGCRESACGLLLTVTGALYRQTVGQRH